MQKSPPPPPQPASPPAAPPAAAEAAASPEADALEERLQALKAGQSRDAAARASPSAQQAEAADEAPPAPKGSLLSGALEEAGLITWPSVKGVISTTAAVFGIVVVSTLLLLSVNALLATLSEKLFG